LKRLIQSLLALAVLLGVCPAALIGQCAPGEQDCFNFSLTASGGVDITGDFTYSTPPVGGVYLVTGFSGTFTDPTGQFNAGPPVTYTPVFDATTILWPDALYPPAGPGIFSYGEDNLFYSKLSPATGTQFDASGVILYATDPVYDLIRIQGTYVNEPGVTNDVGPGGQDVVAVVFENGTTLTSFTDYFKIEDTPNDGVALVQVNTESNLLYEPVPEFGSRWMLTLCVLGLAGAVFFKIRKSSLFSS
jgi:hypothetical protein